MEEEIKMETFPNFLCLWIDGDFKKGFAIWKRRWPI